MFTDKINQIPVCLTFLFLPHRSVFFFVIYMIPYYLYEVILHYKAKKRRRKNKQFVISAHPGIDPGPLIPKSDTLTIRLRCQVVYILVTFFCQENVEISI